MNHQRLRQRDHQWTICDPVEIVVGQRRDRFRPTEQLLLVVAADSDHVSGRPNHVDNALCIRAFANQIANEHEEIGLRHPKFLTESLDGCTTAVGVAHDVDLIPVGRVDVCMFNLKRH